MDPEAHADGPKGGLSASKTGHSARSMFHPNGQLATRTDQRGIVTTYTYDGANRLTTRAYSDAPADAFVLDDAGRIRTATSGRYGTVVERTWKPTGLIATETTTWPADIGGVTSSTLVQYDYDAANRATTVTYPGGTTLARSFTTRNQLDTLLLAGTQLAQASYDNAGRRTSLRYGNGLTDTRTYTDDNRLESTVVGLAAPAQPVLSLGYVYDANRRKTDETDAITATRSQHFGYDDADRLNTWRAGTQTQSWDLTAVGDWKSTTVNGVVEDREHTPVHEIAKVNTVPVLHDAAGNLARTAQGQGFSWDAENRLLMADIAPNSEKTQGQAFYWYDALGRRVAKRVHDSVTRYVHDGWQVIQELDAPVVATPAEAASDGSLANLATVPDGALLFPTYDAEGNRHNPVRVNFQPETAPIPDGFISDKGRGYDVRTNGLSYGWQGAAERPAHTIRHFHPLPQYDTFGPVANGSDTWTWQIALPNGTYPVAIVAGDATSLAHTNNLVVNGQALTDPDPGDDTTVPTYEQGDFDGWLMSVQVTDGLLTITAGAGAFNPTLTHVEIGQKDQAITADMQTRLAEQILAATQRTGGAPFWNGGRTETRSYVWDPAYIDHLIAYQRTNEAGTQTYYAHSGAQYSVQAVSSETGAVVERYSYSAYGERTVEGSGNGRSTIGLTTAFTGRALDEETGLYYFRNRMYSGKEGRFVSRDPMGYMDGQNLYRGYFVPSAVDPNGEKIVFVENSSQNSEDRERSALLMERMLTRIMNSKNASDEFTVVARYTRTLNDSDEVLRISITDDPKQGSQTTKSPNGANTVLNPFVTYSDNIDGNGKLYRVAANLDSILAHEISHAFEYVFNRNGGGWLPDDCLSEIRAVKVENEYRSSMFKDLPLRNGYLFEYPDGRLVFQNMDGTFTEVTK
jgi:RHS repeat-associated protein